MATEHKSPSVKAKGIEVQRSAKRSSSRHTQSPKALPRPRAVLQRAQEDPTSLSPAEVEVLQRTIGLRAVQRMLHPQSPVVPPTVQAKLSVGPVGDKYEQEADRVARQVMNAPVSTRRRQIHHPQDEVQQSPSAQRASEDGFKASSDFEYNLNRSKGGGAPLPDGLRSGFEQKFGAEFSGVRVHTSPQSDMLNRSIQAKAFTSGQDVFFRQGEYAPGTRSGQQLIAHELTHVVQQNGDSVRRKEAGTPSSPAGENKISISSTPNSQVQRKFGFEIELPILFTMKKDYTLHTTTGDVQAKGVPVDAGFGGDTKLVNWTTSRGFYLNPDHSRTLDDLYLRDLHKFAADKGITGEAKDILLDDPKDYMPHSASIAEVVTPPWDENTLSRPQALAKVRQVIAGVNRMFDSIAGDTKKKVGGQYYIGSTVPNADVFQPRLGYFHSTYGIKLAQVPKLFKETSKQAKSLTKYARRNAPEEQHARNLRLTAQSVDAAKTALGAIKQVWPTTVEPRKFLKDKTVPDMTKAAEKDFLGFLTLLSNYFLLMKATTDRGDLGKKLVGMHYYKSDLYDVFSQLDAKVKDPLQDPDTTLLEHVIDAISAAVGVTSADDMNGHLGYPSIRHYLYQILRGHFGPIQRGGGDQQDPDGNTFHDPMLAGSINPYSKKLGPDQLTGGGKTGLGVVMENRHLEYMDSRYGDLLDRSEQQMKEEGNRYIKPKAGPDNRSVRDKMMHESIGAREGGGGPARRPIGEWEGLMMKIYDMVKSINSE